MRALVIATVGVLIGCGAASAAECQIEGGKVSLREAPESYQQVFKVQHPELIGQTFSVARTAGGKRWSALELRGSGGVYSVKIEVTPHATPAVGASSWSGSQGVGIDWKAKGHPVREFEGCIADAPCITVTDGPLTSLDLSPVSCFD